MALKNDFHTVEFFRKVRDEQAAMLQGKTHKEIIAFFAAFRKDKQSLTKRATASTNNYGTEIGTATVK